MQKILDWQKTTSSLLCVLVLLTSHSFSKAQTDTLQVNNEAELRAAIASNRVIMIHASGISLKEKPLPITAVENLTLQGMGDKLTPLILDANHEDVVRVENAQRITFRNLSLGHEESFTHCSGDVLVINHCQDIEIDACDIFGSGVTGIKAHQSHIISRKTTIRDCSEALFSDESEEGSLLFEDCTFTLYKWKEEFRDEYRSIQFKNCDFFLADGKQLLSSNRGYYPESPAFLKTETSNPSPLWENPNDYGEFEGACPSTVEVSSSSSLTSNSNYSYGAQNLSEVNLEPGTGKQVAWVEGVDGPGIGERIHFKIVAPRAKWEAWSLNAEFQIVNGYAKDPETWKANNRVKRLKMSRNGHHLADIQLQDIPNVQRIRFSDLVEGGILKIGDEITFEILEVYRGLRYDDTAITYFAPTCSP